MPPASGGFRRDPADRARPVAHRRTHRCMSSWSTPRRAESAVLRPDGDDRDADSGVLITPANRFATPAVTRGSAMATYICTICSSNRAQARQLRVPAWCQGSRSVRRPRRGRATGGTRSGRRRDHHQHRAGRRPRRHRRLHRLPRPDRLLPRSAPSCLVRTRATVRPSPDQNGGGPHGDSAPTGQGGGGAGTHSAGVTWCGGCLGGQWWWSPPWW